MQREIVQVCDCALDGLFQFVSHRGRVRTPFLFSKVSLFCSLRSLVHSFLALPSSLLSLHCRSARTSQKRFRETLASSWSLSPFLTFLRHISFTLGQPQVGSLLSEPIFHRLSWRRILALFLWVVAYLLVAPVSSVCPQLVLMVHLVL